MNNLDIFCLVDFREVSREALCSLYFGEYDYLKDSLIFVHREAHYISGFNPLYIAYRDRSLSRYSAEFQEQRKDRKKQIAYLQFTKNGFLRTADRVPLGRLDEEERRRLQIPYRCIVKVEMDGVDIENRVLMNVNIIGKRSTAQAQPYPFNKILAAYIQLAEHPVTTFNHILEKL